ncbi:MAG TPA: hypothetical protein VG992_00985 [Candidatus Saccharimonadales bacterium]|nr:hypothetical protein [Candidatus Saccharimonadales bacterium]
MSEFNAELFSSAEDDLSAVEKVSPTFARDYVAAVTQSRLWVDHLLADTAQRQTADDQPVYITRTLKSSYNIQLIAHAALIEHGWPIYLQDDVVDSEEGLLPAYMSINLPGARDHYDVVNKAISRCFSPSYRRYDGTERYPRMAAMIFYGPGKFAHSLPGEKFYELARDNFTDLPEREAARTVMQIFMTSQLADAVGRQSVFLTPFDEHEKFNRDQAEDLVAYERCARLNVRPLDPEQFSGIIHSVVRSVLADLEPKSEPAVAPDEELEEEY